MPFRPMFLCVAAFASLAIPLWALQLLQGIPAPGVTLQWHIHEMLFGFAGATVVGFVLTAGQTWTGERSPNGRGLQLLVGMWLLARVAWLLNQPALGGIADALFFATAALFIGRMTIATRNWRNVFFAPLLLMLAALSGYYPAALEGSHPTLARELLDITLFLILHVVLVVGGRVIPFFTDRALQRAPTRRYLMLDGGALVASILYIGVMVTTDNRGLEQAVALLVAASNMLRWLSWKSWQTRGVPLLWSLHLAYLAIVLGFLMLGVDAPRSAAIHMLAIGGFGLMILSMISRVSLGHSGLPLQLPAGMLFAFGALLVSLIARLCASLVPEYYSLALTCAALAWSVAYLLFLYCYIPILSGNSRP